MKKSFAVAVAEYFKTLPADMTIPNPAYDGQPHIRASFPIAEIIEDVVRENKRDDAKKDAARAMYDAAWGSVSNVLHSTTAPLTASEIFDACENLPEGFTRNKITYGLTHYWTDDVVRIDGKVNTYRIK